MKNSDKKGQKNKGFTLIEAVFAIFIIGATLMTFFTVMAAMMRSEQNARDVIVATNLAQEGIEITRNYRDNNWKDGQLAFCTTGGSSCNSSTPTGKFLADATYNEAAINSSIIAIHPNLSGRFTREIKITDNTGSKIITSSVTITRNSRTIKISDTLYPWADAN